MRGREELATSVLRLILAALKDRDIAERGKGREGGLSDEEIVGLLQSMVKQRRESIKMYEQGHRPELAGKEASEIEIIEGFLPRQMGDDEIRAVVESTIAEVEATALKDIGKVMAILRERHPGTMDFAKASAVAKAALSA
ncbi:MAG: GatB/YqeY domain-containing protein [Rhodospirillaceae bacterium]|nr:GatB/YqeY domain-containing protein [Rhodospirillaceae bacterium]